MEASTYDTVIALFGTVIALFALYAVNYSVLFLIKYLFRLLMKISSSFSSFKPVEALDKDMREKVKAMEDILHYRFKNKTLLQEALTHSSYTHFFPNSPSFERLEFLGDAVLGLAVVEHIYKENPKLDPGKLSLLLDANISNHKFAHVAIRHNLYSSVRHKDPTLDRMVDNFKLAIQDEDSDVSDGGSAKAPDILADIVESIAGAVYVDCNYDLKTLWRVFERLMGPIERPDVE